MTLQNFKQIERDNPLLSKKGKLELAKGHLHNFIKYNWPVRVPVQVKGIGHDTVYALTRCDFHSVQINDATTGDRIETVALDDLLFARPEWAQRIPKLYAKNMMDKRAHKAQLKAERRANANRVLSITLKEALLR